MQQLQNYNEESVDSTGIQIWPSEEILAYYCIRNAEKFASFTSFMELGAGYSGLIGLALAKYFDRLVALHKDHAPQPVRICVTDGQQQCATLLKKNLALNKANLKNFAIGPGE